MGPVRPLTSATAPYPWVQKMPLFLGAIKLQESIFSLPFAYTGMVLAAQGFPAWRQFLWITLAMFGARTFGMCANRIIDRHIDARNPRHPDRHLPSGKLTVAEMTGLALVALGILLFAAARLNPLSLALAPVGAAYLVIYPYFKRITWSANLLLGWALAMAPSAAWIGIKGSLSWEPVLLSLSVALWAGSFDILYHIQDREFYLKAGLHSVAQKFGIAGACQWARTLDAMALACLLALGIWMELGWPYFIGWTLVMALLANKHWQVTPASMPRFGKAFFRTNAYVSTTMFVATLVALQI